MALNAGDPFPGFTALDQEGNSRSLDELRDGGNLVVFFYPRAMTSGCVRETTEFGARAAEFAALHTAVVGVSSDRPALQQRHAVKCSAGFPLLSDAGMELINRLGIANERGNGAVRTTYL